MRWWGALGFLAALMMVLIFAVLVAGSSYYSSGKLGLSTRQRFAFALPRLNPFAAPGAGEALLERTLKGAPPLAVARMLMAAPDFERWIRASAYDAVQRIESERGDELVKVVGRRRLEELVAERPPGVAPGSPWCPRCGAEFGATSAGCPVCEVELKV